MDFDLDDEQRLLKQSVDRLIADHYDFSKRSRYMAEPDGSSAQMWSRYAEMGLLGLPFAEAEGGFGGGPVEIDDRDGSIRPRSRSRTVFRHGRSVWRITPTCRDRRAASALGSGYR